MPDFLLLNGQGCGSGPQRGIDLSFSLETKNLSRMTGENVYQLVSEFSIVVPILMEQTHEIT